MRVKDPTESGMTCHFCYRGSTAMDICGSMNEEPICEDCAKDLYFALGRALQERTRE